MPVTRFNYSWAQKRMLNTSIEHRTIYGKALYAYTHNGDNCNSNLDST